MTAATVSFALISSVLVVMSLSSRACPFPSGSFVTLPSVKEMASPVLPFAVALKRNEVPCPEGVALATRPMSVGSVISTSNLACHADQRTD